MKRTRLLAGVSTATLVVALAACGGGDAGQSASGGSTRTLVANDAFDLKTIDPARSFEFTGVMLDQQIYETALKFEGANVKEPKPGICSFTISPDNKTLTLTMQGNHTFSDGTPVTADDVVFSLQRVQGIGGNPAFLLDGVTVTKKDDQTIVLTSKESNPQLPYILPNPSLGIVNKKAVEANGGTADANDKAENFLNSTGAGSGPYTIESFDVQSKVVLKTNEHYAGNKPAYGRVVIDNVDAATQKVNAQAGQAQLAFSLGPDQVSDMNQGRTKVVTAQSARTIFMWFNMTPEFGKQSANVKFVQAMRHAINYDGVVALAGQGATRPGGMVPAGFVGSLESDPSNTYDQAKAKQLLSESGYNGEPVSILYSNDVSVGGVRMQNVAETIQAQVQPLGINLQLNPQPSSTSLDSFRSGKAQAGVAYWGADYPDPANYLVFAPGESLGKRAAWTPQQAPEADKLAKAAAAATGDARAAAYQAFQKDVNVEGPFIPLIQPAQIVVTSSELNNVVINPVTTTEFATIS